MVLMAYFVVDRQQRWRSNMRLESEGRGIASGKNLEEATAA
jgi:hypothetical protein